jgi:hypothetical protein
MTQNSTPSRVIDIAFGFLPAAFVGCWALVGTAFTFPSLFSGESKSYTSYLMIFLPSITGFLACISLMVVTTSREQTKNKKLHIILLTAGIIETIILFMYLLVTAPSTITSFIWLPLIAISLVFTAFKSISMLSLSLEVKP